MKIARPFIAEKIISTYGTEQGASMHRAWNIILFSGISFSVKMNGEAKCGKGAYS